MGDFSKTLNLLKTNFPMKGNLGHREIEWLKQFNKINIYNKIRKNKKGKKKFILHDGPPYANGKIHIGHAVNKVLKDIIIKSKNLEGFDAPYVPGWDCHGLPIEHQVEKKYGKKLTFSIESILILRKRLLFPEISINHCGVSLYIIGLLCLQHFG